MVRRRPITRREFLDQSARLGAMSTLAWTYDACGPKDVCASAGMAPAPEAWQIGCYTRPWDKYDYRVALDAIAGAGFKYAGLMTTKGPGGLVISVATSPEEAAQVAQEVKKRGLKVASIYGGGIPVDKSLEAGIEGLRRLIDNCAACGARNLLIGGVGDKEQYEPYYKAIAECCDYAAARGIGISVKPHGGLNATGPQCRKTVEFVGNKNFGIWYDPGNIFYYSDGKLNPVDDAPTVDGLVTGMCVKDYKPPKEVLVTPGTGQVDFPAVFATLKAGGFRKGPLVVECLEPGDLPHLLAEAKKARRFVENLTGQKSQEAAEGATGPEPLQAGLVNFALHLDTTGGTQYGADYPYYAEQALRQTLGNDFTLLFGTGTCGDINHIDVTTKERLKSDVIGQTLARTVSASLTGLKAVASPALAVRRQIVDAPLQKFTPQEIEQAKQDMRKVGTDDLPFLDQVRAFKVLDIQSRPGATLPLEVQVVRLSNEAPVVGLPGEVFVDLGLAIKKASPFATTLVVELCQDECGYIPTRKAFGEGCYETVNSRIAPGGGEIMVDTAIGLLKELGNRA